MTDKTVEKPKKGVIKQFLGCVLLSLGLLNTMLTLKAGIAPDLFNYFLIISGSVSLGAGLWQSRK